MQTCIICFYLKNDFLYYLELKKENNYNQSKSKNESLFAYDNNKRTFTERKTRNWQQWQLQAIDSKRIFMHETKSCELNARKSCSIESIAKNIPSRSVQIFIEQPLNKIITDCLKFPKNGSPWMVLQQHYPNLEVIFYDKNEFFNNTLLANLHKRRQWLKGSKQNKYFSEHGKIISLFRGGGLFIDHEKVITTKPLNISRWWNFFVKSSIQGKVETPYKIAGEIMHLIYGHHLSDEIIVNVAKAINGPHKELFDTFLSSLQSSLAGVCGGLN